MDLHDSLTLVIAGVGAAVALVTLLKALIEYQRQGRQKRADQFFQLRSRMKDNENFKLIRELIERQPTASEELAKVPFESKRDYLGLFQEIALVLNSGLMKRQVAHYMFGYYAIRCWDNEQFWSGVNRESPYWSLFRDFVLQMKAAEQTLVDPGSGYTRSDFRF
jgi:hypothetical protein